ncbi:MAG: ABC transporter permease [Anaerolineae bacterium]|nr:ABC transporter permease [Anaerolineae bacterium]MCO5187496.1 ABC transporter permease [Anaerolineae bacterium]MCO5197150.1 ABC transporter permease [Anaerolineae bacterium]MCO5207116.1 ABC transporter permease [Anaerolineae bacterium]
MTSHWKQFRWERALPAVILLSLLLIWETGSRIGLIKPLLFPAPTMIGRSLLDMAASGDLWLHTRATLLRVLLGLLIGGVPALILGLLMGQSRRLAIVLDPIIAAIHPIPKIAIFPLIMVFLGVGEGSKIFIAAFGAFFPILLSTAAGVRQINPILTQVATNYGANRFKLFTRVVLPGSLPSVLTGVLLALNLTLLLTVAIEIITAKEGLGSIIWFSWQTMRTETMYVSLTVLMILGVLFNGCMHWLTRLLTPWHQRTE